MRPFRDEDLPRYAAMNADPEVMAHLGGPISSRWSDRIAEYANELWAWAGIGLLAVERTEDGTFLGACGVHVLESYPDDLEIAWRLAKEHWGHGYATEAAAEWLRVAFEDHDMPRVISVADPGNDRSTAVMGRLGFVFDHEAELTEHGESFTGVVHVLDRATWSNRNATPRR